MPTGAAEAEGLGGPSAGARKGLPPGGAAPGDSTRVTDLAWEGDGQHTCVLPSPLLSPAPSERPLPPFPFLPRQGRLMLQHHLTEHPRPPPRVPRSGLRVACAPCTLALSPAGAEVLGRRSCLDGDQARRSRSLCTDAWKSAS